MAFPNGWGRKCKLTIQSSKVPGDLTNFPVLLTVATLPSEMFDADGSYPALSGGGDIRFSSDADGETQLACEIVTLTINNDPALGKAEIHVKDPSLSGSSNTDLYVWYNKTGESQPSETDTYGKHNVWDSNFKLVQHMNEDPSGSAPQMIDSTSNSNDGTSAGSMTSGDVVIGKVGKGLVFDGVDDRIVIPDFVYDVPLTVSFWFKSTDLTGDLYQYMFSHAGFAVPNSLNMYLEEEGTQGYPGSVVKFQDGTNDLVTLLDLVNYGTVNYQMNTLVVSATDSYAYINASQTGTSTQDNASFNPATDIFIASRSDTNADRFFTGEIDEIRISNIARSTDWITAEYNNQNDPGTFVIEGTPETPSGGVSGNPWNYYAQQ